MSSATPVTADQTKHDLTTARRTQHSYTINCYLASVFEDPWPRRLVIPANNGLNLVQLSFFARAFSLELCMPPVFDPDSYRARAGYRHGYLLMGKVTEGRAAFGGCEVWHTSNGACLSWVWIHPFERRRGMFTKAWQYLEETHPDLTVLGPLGAVGDVVFNKLAPGRIVTA